MGGVPNSEVICTQLYVAGTADSVLIREVSHIQSALYRGSTGVCTWHSLPQGLAHPGGPVHDRIIHAIDLSGPMGEELVLLDLVGEQKLIHELRRSPSQQLVEDVVATLPRLLENDT